MVVSSSAAMAWHMVACASSWRQPFCCTQITGYRELSRFSGRSDAPDQGKKFDQITTPD
jgi:hypothetical protein